MNKKSKDFPFYIIYKKANGKYGFVISPARTRQEAVSNCLAYSEEWLNNRDTDDQSMLTPVLVNRGKEYSDPLDYIDPLDIDTAVYESEEALKEYCEYLTDTDARLTEVIGKGTGRLEG